MAQNTRKMIFFGAIAVFALLLIFNPFAAISKLGGPPRAKLEAPGLEALARDVATCGKPAMAAVLDLARESRVTFMGESGFIAEELGFIQDVVRRSPDTGINAVGLELLLWEDQARIDRFMAAPAFDAALARDLILGRSPIYGFAEYVDLLQALWETGRLCASRGQTLRLYGLSYIQDYSSITRQEDANNPEIIKQILNRGTPDAFMAALITSIAADPAARILVIANRRFCLAKAREVTYTKGLETMGFAETRHAAAIVASQITAPAGQRACSTVLFHSPWPDSESRVNNLCWPVNGQLDQLLEGSGTWKFPALPMAIDTRTSGTGRIVLDHGDYRLASTTRATLADLCDLHVILAPLASLHAATPIPDFVTPQNAGRALEHLPRLASASAPGPDAINSMIRSNAQSLQQDLSYFH